MHRQTHIHSRIPLYRKHKCPKNTKGMSNNGTGWMVWHRSAIWLCCICAVSSEITAWPAWIPAGSVHKQWALNLPADRGWIWPEPLFRTAQELRRWILFFLLLHPEFCSRKKKRTTYSLHCPAPGALARLCTKSSYVTQSKQDTTTTLWDPPLGMFAKHRRAVGTATMKICPTYSLLLCMCCMVSKCHVTTFRAVFCMLIILWACPKLKT